MKKLITTVAIFSIIMAMACSKGGDTPTPTPPPPPPPPSGGVTAANVSYTNYIKGLLSTNCSSCHAAGGTGSRGGWTWDDTYANAKAMSARINVRIGNGTMPQDKAPTGLPQADKDLVQAWINRGAPEN